MTKVFPIFGNTQLEVLSVVASFLLISTHGMTGTCVKEKVLVSSSFVPLCRSLPGSIASLTKKDGHRRSNKGFRKEVKDIWHNLLTLPRIIRQIVGSWLISLFCLPELTFMRLISALSNSCRFPPS